MSATDEGETEPASSATLVAVAASTSGGDAGDAASGISRRQSRAWFHTMRSPRPHHPTDEAKDGVATRTLQLVDTVVYILVGVCFCVAALYSLGYAAYSFATQVAGKFQAGHGGWPDQLFGGGQAGQDIITLVSDLLLTLIIMEVLGTVVHHLRDKETTLKPFLFIGIISATRGILAVGARLSVSTEAHITDDFVRNMIELGVDAVVIIALGAAMKLIGPLLEESTTGGAKHRRDAQARRKPSMAE